jgi:hypothetical protein
MPEEGDIILLAEAINFKNKSKKDVGILSQDKDLIVFAKTLQELYKIKIYSN